MKSPNDAVRASVRYVGRVQGVGFRATAQALAQRSGVHGWVRNEANGSVQLEAQASAAVLDRFLADIQAHFGDLIQRVERSTMSPVSGETDFVIRRG